MSTVVLIRAMISRKRKVDNFTCWCVKAVMFPAGLCRSSFSVNQQTAAFLFGVFFLELEKIYFKKLEALWYLVYSQLHLVFQMAVEKQIHIYKYTG